jgi:hypothetical protein|tara:strand:+ start:34483 stop:34797 length:315 start_codon:yes stop_codon:yes gene_type:complete
MHLESVLFAAFLTTAILHLAQVFVYGFREFNRPTVLFGVIFLFLTFALSKDEAWIKWAIILVPLTGFVGVLNGFSDSHKPNWLNYLMILFNLILVGLAVSLKLA